MFKYHKLTYLIFLFFIFSISFSQEKFTISGTVADSISGERLIGVNIIIPELKTGAITNEYGFYSLTLPQGKYTINVSYLGFNDVTRELNLFENIKLDIQLNESSEELQEIIVSENPYKTNIKRAEMSVNRITTASIKQMPVVLGETDVIKSILTLPGVTNAGEGQSGFNVRGGAADQNLVLLDEATLFNTSHLFGFFSVFNTDAIKDIKLYKGGIPSRFGGRVASVLEIYQKEGNNSTFHMNGGIGLISSRLLAEGPIKKNKGSFLFAGRSSYAHLFLKLANNNNSAYFYDLNTKLSYTFNDRNSLYLSGYFGRDVFSLNEQFVNTYGNSVFNLRWNHLFSDKLFSNLSLIYSDYYYGLTLDFVGFNWDSGIKNYNIKYDFKHYLNDKIKLFYGANAIYYDFNPGKIEPTNSNSGINSDQLAKKYAFEPAVYIDVEHNISNKIALNYGIRFSKFYRLGNEEINIYENNQAVIFNEDFQIYEKANPIDSKRYGSNEIISQFSNLEPRIALSYAISDERAIKASYNRMTQYLHLISNTQSPTPLDVWTPSDDFLQPQILDQFAIGYFQDFNNGGYALEIETFFKKVKNRLDYIDGADLIANDDIEQVVLNGEARAYGIELLFRKNKGRLTGWTSYTLSRSEQRTPGRNSLEPGINNGEWYKTGWDKLHNLSITGMYKLNDKWSFSSIFTLQSGQPVTFPNGQYQYQGINIPTYDLRNENRLPTYHRLDIAATLIPEKNKNRNWYGEWVFGIYNLYNRRNAASISFRQNQDSGNNEAVRLSIFGIVPSVTYNFKF